MQLSTKDFTTETRDPPPGLIAVHKATGFRIGLVLRVGEEVGDMVQVEKQALYDSGKLPPGMTREEAETIARAAIELWDIETDQLTDGLR